MSNTESFYQRWSIALKISAFRIEFVSLILALLCIPIFIPGFFDYIQQRSGVVLHDPVLDLIGPADVSWITFTIIYASLIIALISIFFSPEKTLVFMYAYCILTLLRVISLFLVPLEEPTGIIELNDPFTAIVGYEGNVITKDLFFSGHVSTMTLLFFSTGNKKLKSILLIATIIVGFLILLQHVHYTIDVVSAPIFSFIAYRSANYLHSKFSS